MLKRHRDVLEPGVIALISIAMICMHVVGQIGFDKINLCKIQIDAIWPLNRIYIRRLAALGVSDDVSCYVVSSIAVNFVILLGSFTLAFLNRVRSGWLNTRVIIVGNWPPKVAGLLLILVLFVSFQNFSTETSVISLDIDRPLWISIAIVTIYMGVILMLILHLSLISVKLLAKVFFPERL